eukprot:NODE_1587_length_573_cov_5.221374_g1157_i1.p1 GENE.NODE_1587_length_573_cov_5.221374_g1157_i1~~NODE_1587_length_573_cov_5.221374_g1157_i1.p1  ORF type:complete len:62 (-),score=2.05 NODE_1587_length_573_cov_5.221374_g1157_i1:38-223(-)
MAKMLIFLNLTAVAPPPGPEEPRDPKTATLGSHPCSSFWGSGAVRASPKFYGCKVWKHGGA